MATPPPSYRSASISRSHTSPDAVRSAAEAMLRASITSNPSSRSSVATVVPYRASASSLGSEEHSVARSMRGSRSPSTPGSRMGDARSITSSSRSSSTLAMTTTRTRERLRNAELERDELRLAVDQERAIAERLKMEGRGAEISPSEAQSRLHRLEKEMRLLSTDSPRRNSGMFKQACSTDLLFLIDTTGSMYGHINAAKEQVKSIVDSIKQAFLNDADVRIAVVGYKDHNNTPNIQFLDFTTSADEVRSFLNTLEADGGDDLPEDVLGGIRQALNATWKQQTRCIIHIGDAPPHSRDFYLDSDDNYPEPGSEPHGLTYQPLLKNMVDLNINYALLRICNDTDLMAFTFLQEYRRAFADCKLHISNKHYYEACQMAMDYRTSLKGKGTLNGSGSASLLFEEMELGTTYSALKHLVVKMVTSSASRTAVRMSASTRARNTGKDSRKPYRLGSIDEDGDDEGTVLETVPPQWDTPGWLNETLVVEGFSPDVIVHDAKTLDHMMESDDNIKMSITELTIHKRLRPFAQGALRVASFARLASSTNRFVVKSFKRGGKRLAHVAEDMRCQALCKAFALEFNALAGEEYSLDFNVTTCLKGKSGIGSGAECISLEPFIEGTYIKYNNNCGYVNNDDSSSRHNQAAQALSHFTFERSRGRFLVSDLQGVGNILTDPAIHTLDDNRFRLADTNLGKDGFKFFFATHVCNAICKKLELKSNASMIMTGLYHFRETWPSMDNTVCCSNKFCGKIVRISSAKRADEYPGYNWCDRCWPQLRVSIVNRLCVAPGPHHEFRASEFFYESQGRSTSRTCPLHSEDNLTSRTAVVGGTLWARLKSATKKRSSHGSRRS